MTPFHVDFGPTESVVAIGQVLEASEPSSAGDLEGGHRDVRSPPHHVALRDGPPLLCNHCFERLNVEQALSDD